MSEPEISCIQIDDIQTLLSSCADKLQIAKVGLEMVRKINRGLRLQNRDLNRKVHRLEIKIGAMLSEYDKPNIIVLTPEEKEIQTGTRQTIQVEEIK